MRLEGICTWGWILPGGVILGSRDERCENLAGTPCPYGVLCDEHVMELRLRLLLVPQQLGLEY